MILGNLSIDATVSATGNTILMAGTSAQNIGGDTAAILNNLTINCSGGVTLGNDSITLNGTLTLTSGTLDIAANTLTLTGNSPVRTSGNIDASDASANLVFENVAAITLPASIF